MQSLCSKSERENGHWISVSSRMASFTRKYPWFMHAKEMKTNPKIKTFRPSQLYSIYYTCKITGFGDTNAALYVLYDFSTKMVAGLLNSSFP